MERTNAPGAPHARSGTGFELVAGCARTEIAEPVRRRTARLLEEPVDWRHVWRLSALNGVQPLVYKSLSDHFAELVPAPVLAGMKRAYLQSAMQNLRLGHEMARVIRLLQAEDVRVLPFKGPVLASTAYGSLGLRHCGDIDLLVAADRYAQVEALLLADGYQLPRKVQELGAMQKRVHLYITQQYPFVNAGQFFIDLHTGAMPAGYHFPLTLERLWPRSRRVVVADAAVRDCQPEDTLLILCYQGLKNQWGRLKHVCDVAELLRSHPDLNWDVVLERARAMHGERILHLGLSLAHDVSGAPVPDEVLRDADSDPAVASLADQATQLLRADQTDVELSWRMRFHLKAQDHWSTKLRYGAYTALRRVEEVLENSSRTEVLPVGKEEAV